MKYPLYVAEIIDKLENNGHEAYIVGGSVRDMLLGKEPNDYDVTTSALPERTLEIFSDKRTIPTGLKHGTVTVMTEGGPIEVTTFRVDGEYKDSRRPESVSFTGNIADDLARRDFTVNAMAYSERNGLIDLYGGQKDLENKIIRAVGEPKQRFSEDALRIMRAFRFSSQLDFLIDTDTVIGIKQTKEGLSKIAAERIASEFIRTICTNTPYTSLLLMQEMDILDYVTYGYLPDRSAGAALSFSSGTPCVRLGIYFSGLEKESSRAILHSLKLSNKLISDTLRIAEEASKNLCGSNADARRLIARCGELTPLVIDAARALGNLDAEFESKLKEETDKRSCATSSALAVNGGDIVKLGARGREVGRLLEYLLERVIEEPEINKKETLLRLAKEKMTENIGGQNE